ncbi:hypothetical protein PENTCL1PPCAC_1042 [Pristionchus entomophagus]|uniref:glucuronosyltransferase n=1 Tax=Pristionchus entomophagus TaxID=358040 RepID=A0AAV5S7F2_9BILA|nr:hypothetical protein PENTCL1PPCAC_1042 [Pristionchus entomophagus]
MQQFLLLLLLPLCCSYKFLVYSPKFASSHVNFMGRISDVLVEAGHEVVMLSPQLDNNIPNAGTKLARVIEIPQIRESEDFEDLMNNKMVKNAWKETSMLGMMDGVELIMDAWVAQCNATFHHPGLVEQLKSEMFDVGYTESIDFCSIGLFHLAGIDKYAVTESLAMVDGHFFYSQVPSNPAYVPSMASGFAGEQMTFLERTSNFLISVMSGIAKDAFLDRWQTVFTSYDPSFPSLKDLTSQNSLVFINSEPLVEFPRPSAARIIDIGGISVSKGAKKLNKTWSDILDLRPKTVLISFGTFAKAHLMLAEYKKSIAETAKRFPDVTFIWKYEISEHRVSEGVENLIETTWMPQNDILHDPRLSAFITHGGQGSITESYYAGVPQIVIPVCFDQLRNAAQVKRNGVGLVVEKTQLVNSEALTAAIDEILGNKIYRANAKKVQQTIKDRPFPMSEIFVKNMEFLAKHGPLRQLDHYGRHLNVFQYYLIDVIAFVAMLVLSVVLIAFLLIRKCARKFVKLVRRKVKGD